MQDPRIAREMKEYEQRRAKEALENLLLLHEAYSSFPSGLLSPHLLVHHHPYLGTVPSHLFAHLSAGSWEIPSGAR
jgi:hypothetical protein